MDALCLKAGGFHGKAAPSVGAAADKPSATPARNLPWGFTFRHPLRSLWPGNKMRHEPVNSANDAVLADEIKEIDVDTRNWNSYIPNLLLNLESEKATSVKPEEIENNVEEEKGNCGVADKECDACAIDDDENIKFDRESFSKLLKKVPLAEARLYALLSYLGCLSYSIPQIKPGNLLRNHGLRFVTSSLEKKVENAEVESKPETGNENVCEEEMSDVAPCEWFVCDDDRTATRFFVIQGSESLASWQANLQFEPIQFEGSEDVVVHRGIYEAAKTMYKQMLPEIHAHLKSHPRATFRFTGHSLGGSLSVLVNLMLLIRGEAPRSSLLLPVVTYGAPSIMCGGDRLLRDLGLPRNHVRSITMHRDIVPRAFSCNYPDRVVELLKAVNGNFRNHPCLDKQKLLYSPMGELLILQPDDTFSPSHDLLPPGGGLYILTGPTSGNNRIRAAAQGVFLNSPHPLEILSDRSAYGPEGNIQRDHDMVSYLKSVRNVIRQELERTRAARRVLWPPGVNGGGVVVSGRRGRLFGLSGMVGMGKESLNRRFSTLVASQHVHLAVVVLGTYCSFMEFDFA